MSQARVLVIEKTSFTSGTVDTLKKELIEVIPGSLVGDQYRVDTLYQCLEPHRLIDRGRTVFTYLKVKFFFHTKTYSNSRARSPRHRRSGSYARSLKLSAAILQDDFRAMKPIYRICITIGTGLLILEGTFCLD